MDRPGIGSFGDFLHLSYLLHGYNRCLWCQPIIAAVFFVLPWRYGAITNSCLVLLAIVFCFSSMEFSLAIRMAVSLIASFVLLGVFSIRIRLMQEELRSASNLDPMTGANNRRLLNEALNDSVAAYQLRKSTSAIAIFDLDNFKQINDCMGHAAGDSAIIELVLLINQHINKNDRVYRLGGDEILLHFCNEPREGFKESVDQIIDLIARNDQIATTSSSGMAILEKNLDVEQWLNRADLALYEAKRRGRNQAVAWYPQL